MQPDTCPISDILSVVPALTARLLTSGQSVGTAGPPHFIPSFRPPLQIPDSSHGVLPAKEAFGFRRSHRQRPRTPQIAKPSFPFELVTIAVAIPREATPLSTTSDYHQPVRPTETRSRQITQHTSPRQRIAQRPIFCERHTISFSDANPTKEGIDEFTPFGERRTHLKPLKPTISVDSEIAPPLGALSRGETLTHPRIGRN